MTSEKGELRVHLYIVFHF